MNAVLSALALVVAVLSFLTRPREHYRRPMPVELIAFALLVVAGVVITAKWGPASMQAASTQGFVLGAAALLMSHYLGTRASLGLGVAAAAVVPTLGTGPAATFALIASAVLGGIALEGRPVRTTAITFAVVAAAQFLLGRYFKTEAAATAVPALGLAAAAGQAIAGVVAKGKFRGEGAALGLLIGAFVLNGRLGGAPAGIGALQVGIWAPVLAGIVAAGLAQVLLPDEGEITTFRGGLCAIIWIATATASFGAFRGTGMALAAFGALALLVPGDRKRALASVGPLVGLVLYRLLREAHPEVSKALDIGQHYGLIGLVLGLVFPLVHDELQIQGQRKRMLGAILFGLLAMGLPLIVFSVFTGVGMVGFIVGAGLAGLLESVRSGKVDSGLTTGIGVAGVALVVTEWMTKPESMTRDEKVHFLTLALGGVLIVGVALALLARQPKSEVTA